MLNQLVESKNHQQEAKRRSGFLVGTLGILVAVLVSGWTYSLFAKSFGMGSGEFEAANLVAPLAVAEEAPPPKIEVKQERSPTAESGKITLKDLYDDVSSSKVPPKDTRGERDVVSARNFDLDNVKLGDYNQIPAQTGRTTSGSQNGCGLCSNDADNKSGTEEDEKAPEVVEKPTPKPTVEPKKTPPTVSLGVINGKASTLAKPSYPPAAKQMGISGAVNVQVTIDEKGNVISAAVVSGHPLLRSVALAAAKQSKFTPTLLSNQPVKVTGVIVYNFQP